jgi:hypothetical protein
MSKAFYRTLPSRAQCSLQPLQGPFETVLSNIDVETDDGTIEVQVKAGKVNDEFVIWADWWDHSSISLLAAVDPDGSWG